MRSLAFLGCRRPLGRCIAASKACVNFILMATHIAVKVSSSSVHSRALPSKGWGGVGP